jgi:hypothetical protein
MDCYQRVTGAKEKMRLAESELERYTTSGPEDLTEYARLSEAAKDARREYTGALDSMALSLSESTSTIVASKERGRAK